MGERGGWERERELEERDRQTEAEADRQTDSERHTETERGGNNKQKKPMTQRRSSIQACRRILAHTDSNVGKHNQSGRRFKANILRNFAKTR